jgi:hypothetical protein
MYEMSGTVKKIGDVQTFASGFSKRELIVEEEKDSKWPNVVAFTFKKDGMAKIENVKPGDRVKVGFAVDGREWTDPKSGTTRYFTDLTGLFVEPLAGIPDAPAEAEAPRSNSPLMTEPAPSVDDEDLPF